MRQMHSKVTNYMKKEIKKGLARLDESHRNFFKRLYSHENQSLTINEIVDDIPDDKLNWALIQVENSIKNEGR